jgi:hypothetical protein
VTFGLLELDLPAVWLGVAAALVAWVFRQRRVLVSSNELRIGAERFPAASVHGLRLQETATGLGFIERFSFTACLWLDTSDGRHLLLGAGWARDVRAALDRLRAAVISGVV